MTGRELSAVDSSCGADIARVSRNGSNVGLAFASLHIEARGLTANDRHTGGPHT